LKKEREEGAHSDLASVEPHHHQLGKGKEKQQFGPEVEELKKLTKQLVMQGPMASSKWTWGVDLTENDLRSLIRGADRQYQLPHSGYDEELASSLENRTSEALNPVDLEDPNDPNINLLFDKLSPSIMVVPELHPDDFPNYSEIMFVPEDDVFESEPDPVIEAFTK